MARIDGALLQRIAEKLDITVRAVYPHIARVSRETFLDNDLAALVLASRLHINIGRYSTQDQREQIRSAVQGSGSSASVSASNLSQVGTPAARGVRGKVKKPTRKKDNSVFVIGGRDKALTDSMFALLRALGCRPVDFHQAVAKVKGAATPFIGQVLDSEFERVQALVVLFSPDDEVKLKDQFVKANEVQTEGRYLGQARPNVIFEAGMAMASHPEKTIMVRVGEVKEFSDLAGRHMVHLDNSFTSRNDFAGRLAKLCTVDRSGHDWPSVGRFVPTAPNSGPARKPRKRG